MGYADLRNYFLFQRVFGQHEDVLCGLLNDLLACEGDRAIASLTFIPSEEPAIAPGPRVFMHRAHCQTGAGEAFVAEVQLLPVTVSLNEPLFEACKAAVETPVAPHDVDQSVAVVAVSICDFVLWNDADQDAKSAPRVPMVSRWTTRKPSDATRIHHVFLELPKLGDHPLTSVVERWAWLFRNAPTLNRDEVTASLKFTVIQRKALGLADSAGWSPRDIDTYLRAREEVDQVVRMVEAARQRGWLKGFVMGRVERCLNRALTDAERLALRAQITRQGAETMIPLVESLDAEACDLWLATLSAR